MQSDTHQTTLSLYLDNNHTLPVLLHVEQKDGQPHLSARFNDPQTYQANPRFLKNIRELLGVRPVGKAEVTFAPGADGTSQARLPVADGEYELTVNKKPVARFTLANGAITADETINRRLALAVSETRMLAREMTKHQLQTLPYERNKLEQLDDTCLPITELHTHLSAQLTGEEWSDIIKASNQPVYYPVDMLELIKQRLGSPIDLKPYTHPEPIARTVSFKPAVDLDYPPLDSEKPVKKGDTYQCVDLHQLAISDDPAAQAFYKQFIALLMIPIDSTIGPEEMDTKFYRYRNPLEKNPALQEAKILKVAEKHSKQGIRYAEMSSTEVLSPEWLEATTKAIIKAKKKFPDTDIRLLAGIHRSKAPELIAQDLEKVKIAAHNPYVVGVDFMGYESNKSESINWAIHEMARWVRRSRIKHRESPQSAPFTDDFAIRIHAGETSKNANNVQHAIELAESFDVTIRVGHLLRGEVSSELKQKAKRHGIFLEFIPDSNIALQNMDYPTDLLIKDWINKGCRFTVNSDGAGAYQTDPLQQAKVALFSGLEIADLQRMQQYERDYAATRSAFLDKKIKAFQTAFPADGLDGSLSAFSKNFQEQINNLKPDPAKPKNDLPLPKRYDGKMPILLAGSSGSKWDHTPDTVKRQIRLATRMMTTLFDPHHVYFCTGRVKDRGIEKELDHAIVADDAEHYQARSGFDMVATYAGGFENLSIATGVNWVNKTAGSPEHVADNVVEFMEHKGKQARSSYALFVGGGDFTREFIEETYKRGLPFGMVLIDQRASKNGHVSIATNDKARYIPDKHIIEQSKDLPLAQAILRHMMEHVGIERLRPEIQQALSHDNRPDSMQHLIQKTYEKVEAEDLKFAKPERTKEQ